MSESQNEIPSSTPGEAPTKDALESEVNKDVIGEGSLTVDEANDVYSADDTDDSAETPS